MERCPRCGGPLGKRPALSRRDNKTDICSRCGLAEALEDAEKAFAIKRKGEVKND